MNNPFLNLAGVQQQTLLRSVQKIGQVSVEKASAVTDQQIASLAYYADLGLGQMRNAVNIRDADSLQQYMVGQNRVIKAVGDKIVEDTRNLAKLGTDYSRDLQQVIQQTAAQSKNNAEQADKT